MNVAQVVVCLRSGAVVCSWSLLIRGAQRARHQAETPLIALCRFPGPALTEAAYYCSTVRTSPQTRHRKVCNSGNVATLGVVRASIIGFPQVGHGGGGSSSFWDITFVKAQTGKQNDIAQKEAPSFRPGPSLFCPGAQT